MFKIILIIPKRDYDLKILFILKRMNYRRDDALKILFIPKRMNYRRDYALKTILISERIINRIGTMLLKYYLFRRE